MRPSTLEWIVRYLDVDEQVLGAEPLPGGITAEVLKLTIGTPHGATRQMVLKSYVDPHVSRHEEDWLRREAKALTLVGGSGVPAPELIAVDPTARICEYPSILMSHLHGRTVITDEGSATRIPLLARQLAEIHALRTDDPPQDYQVSTTAETVVVPVGADETLWSAATDLIRKPAPPYEGRILHRDFQPGNVLFDVVPGSADTGVSGVVDWAGTSLGPADLDVAHCATNLALLHGPEWGPRFAAAYQEAGGVLAATAEQRRYWRVRDALACSEEVHLWAAPWREAGRPDLTAYVVEQRLNAYLSQSMSLSA